ncbi:protein kinase-like domain, Concanavalin A-like lectin/glucanase domain, Lectin [Artemisia annua]|uniref:Protein kinase-like domain, Concanavalin A-like lectin/glucanase domain, Lectin n=1 Tax=Artemisia annua TaxID=35608 RepID=A0A2U1NFD0_ARTAN|nr:protein kinase-like domain, Concanavalin A-like lectin/glucanase domain, Lectin [Artemisia annua]
MYRMKKIRDIVDPRLADYDDLQMKGLVALGLGNQVELVKWVEKMYRMKEIREIIDPRLADYDDLQMKGLVALGLWCVRLDGKDRPLMREIVHVLNNTQDTQDPLSDPH